MGGSPCSGKSSIADALARQYGWRIYRCDDAFPQHMAISSPAGQPVLSSLRGMADDALWLRPVAEQLRTELEAYREEFAMIMQDLACLDRDRPILAEGAALLPECVTPLLDDPRQAVWVVPTAAFQREHYARRPWVNDVVKNCTDPRQAFDNWMERDIHFAHAVHAQAQERGLRVLVVDGGQTLAQNTALVDVFWKEAGNACSKD